MRIRIDRQERQDRNVRFFCLFFMQQDIVSYCIKNAPLQMVFSFSMIMI